MKRSTVVALGVGGVSGVAAVTSTWKNHTEPLSGRVFFTYVPQGVGPLQGTAMFLHGVGGNEEIRSSDGGYNVAKHADAYGFVAIVPRGSTSSESNAGGASGKSGKRELAADGKQSEKLGVDNYDWSGKTGSWDKGDYNGTDWDKDTDWSKSKGTSNWAGSFMWNIDDYEGVNEVPILKAMVTMTRNDIAASGRDTVSPLPAIALGFSNGAGMAAILGCHNSTSLWVAHVGVHIDMDAANFPSTCSPQFNKHAKNTKVWSGIGSRDFFLDTVEGDKLCFVKKQFETIKTQVCDSSTPEVAPNLVRSRADPIPCNSPNAALRDLSGKGGEESRSIYDQVCYSSAGCSRLGELCLYPDMDHVPEANMTGIAWEYLVGYTKIDFATPASSYATRYSGSGLFTVSVLGAAVAWFSGLLM